MIIRSAFEHCLQRELSKQGFDQKKIITLTIGGLVLIIMILGAIYCLMIAANAFGAMSAMLSSAMSALAIGFFHLEKKKKKDGGSVQVKRA